MPYLRVVRNSLLITNDQELFLLLKANSSKPEFSYKKYVRFSIESIKEPECLSEFRVAKKDLPLQLENHCRQVRGVMYFPQVNVVFLPI